MDGAPWTTDPAGMSPCGPASSGRDPIGPTAGAHRMVDACRRVRLEHAGAVTLDTVRPASRLVGPAQPGRVDPNARAGGLTAARLGVDHAGIARFGLVGRRDAFVGSPCVAHRARAAAAHAIRRPLARYPRSLAGA